MSKDLLLSGGIALCAHIGALFLAGSILSSRAVFDTKQVPLSMKVFLVPTVAKSTFPAPQPVEKTEETKIKERQIQEIKPETNVAVPIPPEKTEKPKPKELEKPKIKESKMQEIKPDIAHYDAVTPVMPIEKDETPVLERDSTIFAKQGAITTAAPNLVRELGHEGVDKSAIDIRPFIDRIESLRHYPYIARRRGMEGTAIVFVHLSKTGELIDIALRASSGYEILDTSALELIKKATPFRHGHHSDLKIEIPISYRFKR